MGDAVTGIVASFVLSQIGVVIAFAVGGYSTADDIPLWLVGVVEIPLWIGLLGTLWLASTRKGTGSLRADFGLAMRPRDLPIGLAAGFFGQLGIILVVSPIYKLLGIDT